MLLPGLEPVTLSQCEVSATEERNVAKNLGKSRTPGGPRRGGLRKKCDVIGTEVRGSITPDLCTNTTFSPASTGKFTLFTLTHKTLYKEYRTHATTMSLKAAELGIRAAIGLGAFAYNHWRGNHASSSNSTLATSAPLPMPQARRNTMPLRRRRRSGRAARRSSYTRRVVPRNTHLVYSYVRRATASVVTLVSGNVKVATDTTLNSIFLSDLVQAYDMYRIRKVVFEVVPYYDPATGGPGANAGNQHGSNYFITFACDSTGGFTTASWSNEQDLAQFENYKYKSIVAGEKAFYTFYPKVTNTVDNSGTAVPAGNYTVNPWLNMSRVDVPHHRLLYQITSPDTLNNGSFIVTPTIYFDVMRCR